MMTTIDCRYTGDLHCEAVHRPSGGLLHTDAPTDHDGLGESFSPTDLLATSLGTCVLTIMESLPNGVKYPRCHRTREKHMTGRTSQDRTPGGSRICPSSAARTNAVC